MALQVCNRANTTSTIMTGLVFLCYPTLCRASQKQTFGPCDGVSCCSCHPTNKQWQGCQPSHLCQNHPGTSLMHPMSQTHTKVTRNLVLVYSSPDFDQVSPLNSNSQHLPHVTWMKVYLLADCITTTGNEPQTAQCTSNSTQLCESQNRKLQPKASFGLSTARNLVLDKGNWFCSL